jgi:hypothetical protein
MPPGAAMAFKTVGFDAPSWPWKGILHVFYRYCGGTQRSAE